MNVTKRVENEYFASTARAKQEETKERIKSENIENCKEELVDIFDKIRYQSEHTDISCIEIDYENVFVAEALRFYGYHVDVNRFSMTVSWYYAE